MFRCRPVSLVLVGLFLWTTACTSYSQIEPGEVADHNHIRVTLMDGARPDLYGPFMEADSIKGGEPGYPDRVLSIPLDQVSKLESVGTDELGTALTVVGVFVGAILLIGAVGCATNDADSLAC